MTANLRRWWWWWWAALDYARPAIDGRGIWSPAGLSRLIGDRGGQVGAAGSVAASSSVTVAGSGCREQAHGHGRKAEISA
jgi:hypothetical protein